MPRITEGLRRWLWFVALYLGSVAVFALLLQVLRWALGS